jgi:hypothetical protein
LNLPKRVSDLLTTSLQASLYNLIALNNLHLIAKYIFYLKAFNCVKLFLKAITPSLTNYLRWLRQSFYSLASGRGQ